MEPAPALAKLAAAPVPLTIGNVPSGLDPFIIAELARSGEPVAYVLSDGQRMADLEQMLGFIALTRDDRISATAAFKKATELDARYGNAWDNLAAQYLYGKNYDGALDAASTTAWVGLSGRKNSRNIALSCLLSFVPECSARAIKKSASSALTVSSSAGATADPP